MTRKAIYRCVAMLFMFFAVGHTTGVLGTKDLPKEALEMRTAMFATHFKFMGADSTYGGFFEGYGLVVTLFLLFSSSIAWTLGDLSKDIADAARPIAWGLAVSILINAILAFHYFFAGPVVLSVLIAMGIGAAESRPRN
jgi:hypothetical protein